MKPPRKLPYRRGVGIVLVNKHGKVFVGERVGVPGSWQMPQGGIDEGEKPRRAALRELLEEVGTDKAEIVAASKGWLRYELPEKLVGVAWGGKYRGQKQKWYVMRFTGRDGDIDIATDHPEFETWKWMAFARLPRVIVPFKRELYLKVVAEFAPLLAKMEKKKPHPAGKKAAQKKTKKKR